MTQEEKAKAYDEALERAKKYNIDDAHAYQGTIVKLIFPELAKSEDEKIRKEMIRYFTEMKKGGSASLPYDDCIAYLERQKEQKLTDTEWAELQSEFKNINEAFEDGKKEVIDNPEKYGLQKENKFAPRVLPCSAAWFEDDDEEQKEQKPADEAEKFFDSAESYNQGFVAGQKKMKEDIEKGFGISEHSLDYLAGRYAGYAAARQEQKPAEWSEEEHRMLGTIEKVVRLAMDARLGGYSEEQYKDMAFFLHTIRRPQPKQEWSEEDDRICHLIMANLSESARHAITLPMETVNDFNNWLRTLQCMPPVFTDWNEEDQTLLSDVLGCVTMVQELKKRGKLKNFHISCSYDELRSWVRSLKSRPRKQPSWKPSEEQMEAFKDYIEDFQAKAEAAVGGWNNFDVMIELYEQLKKLF